MPVLSGSTWPGGGTTGPCWPSPRLDGKTTVTTLVRDMLAGSEPGRRGGRQHRRAAGGRHRRPGDRRVRGGGLVVPARALAPVHAPGRHVAQLRRRPPRQPSDGRRLRGGQGRIWRDQAPGQVAVGNLDGAVVARRLRRAAAARSPSASGTGAEVTVADGVLLGPGGVEVVAVADLPRRLPHDVSNALAAVATALSGRATPNTARPCCGPSRGSPIAWPWWGRLAACGTTTTPRPRRRLRGGGRGVGLRRR